MRIFREKSVPGMDRIGIRNFGSADDPVDLQIAFRTRRTSNAHRLVGQLDVERVDIGLGIDRYRRNTQFFASSDDPQRDLAAVSDQDFIKHNYFTRKRY